MKKLTFTQLQNKFFDLPPKDQQSFLKDLYMFSPATKQLWQGRFSKNNNGAEFLEKLKKIHKKLEKTTKDVPLKDIRQIVNNAKKSYVSSWGLLDIYQISYRIILNWGNDFGYFPENLENSSGGYFEAYLKLLNTFINDPSEREKRILDEKEWLETKYNNVCLDYFSAIFEDETSFTLNTSW